MPLLSLEDEVALEEIVSFCDAKVESAQAVPIDLPLELLIGILLHPAPVRPGTSPVAVGTRYLLRLGDTPDDTQPLSLTDAAQFIPQSALLAGRVIKPQQPDETLLETALGTIALALTLPVPQGTAIRIRVSAVAPPGTKAATLAETSDTAPTIPDDVLTDFPDGDATIDQFMTQLLLPADMTALTNAWRYLTDAQIRRDTKMLTLAIKEALAKSGKIALSAKFDLATKHLGDIHPQVMPGGWLMTTLPFFGVSSNEPMRVYTKSSHEDVDAKEQKRGGERVVLEVSLRDLGSIQFDGLVRDRRFDLVLRTEHAFDSELRTGIESKFQSAMRECGWSGGIAFGSIAKFPLMNIPEPAWGIGMSV